MLNLNRDTNRKTRTGERWEDPLRPQAGWQRCSFHVSAFKAITPGLLSHVTT